MEKSEAKQLFFDNPYWVIRSKELRTLAIQYINQSQMQLLANEPEKAAVSAGIAEGVKMALNKFGEE